MKLRRPDGASEQRLDALREEARAKGHVGGTGVRPAGAPFPVADAASGYYGRPLLKQPTWTWEVPAYFFIGGAAGAAAVVGAASRLGRGNDKLRRDARWIAALGGAASAPLLVADLGRPERFLAMLRVFKRQSPMSVGAWTLTAFSTAAAAAAFADWYDRRSGGSVPVRVVGDAAELLAAATGLVMTTYTGVLIGATTIPVWSRNVRLLPHLFASSALGSAVSLLELLGHRQRALNWIGLAAAAMETYNAVLPELSRDAAEEPLRRGRSGLLVRAGAALSGPVPLLLRLTGARRAAAVATIAGSILTRYGWIEAGRVSARDSSIPLDLACEDEIRGPAARTRLGREGE